jgi:hypothetical protein
MEESEQQDQASIVNPSPVADENLLTKLVFEKVQKDEHPKVERLCLTEGLGLYCFKFFCN